MNTLKHLALVTLVIFITACSKPGSLDSNGNTFEIPKDKYVLINYWATWCAPCITEIPELNELAEEYKDQLVVVGVNFDQAQGEELQKQVKKMKITFPVAQEQLHETLGLEIPKVLPTTYILAPGGKLHNTLVGPQTKESLLAALD